MKENEYVEYRDGGYYVAGSRVSLESIVYQFRDGLSPETIATECFPVLTLEKVYGAITYYLGHREEIDEYVKRTEAEWKTFAAGMRERYPQANERFEELRRTLEARRA